MRYRETTTPSLRHATRASGWLLLLIGCHARPAAVTSDAEADTGTDAAVPVSFEASCNAYAAAMCAAFQRCEPFQTSVHFACSVP